MKLVLVFAPFLLSLFVKDAEAVDYYMFKAYSGCTGTLASKAVSDHNGNQTMQEAECAEKCCNSQFNYEYFVKYKTPNTCSCMYKKACEKPDGGTVGRTCDLFKCSAPPSPSSGGDPHFTTFNGTKFDFHGGCDLVLLSNPDFEHGRGLFVQGRTQVESTWSRIDAAAIKLGGHTLEIKSGKKQIKYWLDGLEVSDMETGDAALGDHAIRFKRINEYQSQTRVDLGHGNALSIETYKLLVRVNVKAADADKFVGTYGMYGSYPGGKLVGRDKTTVFDNTDEFGFEWQVRATDPQIFHSAGPIEAPMKCAMPDMTKKSQARRRLGEATISEEEAALACARVNEHDLDACIFDVLATNDKDMAGSY